MRIHQGARDVAGVTPSRCLRLNTSDLRCIYVTAVVRGHGLCVEGIWINHAFVPCTIDEYILSVYCFLFDSRVRVRGGCGGE